MLSKLKYRFKVLKVLNAYASGVRPFFFLNITLSLVSMLLAFANPQFYKIFIDEVIVAGHFSKMPLVIVCYLVVFCIGVLLGYLKNYSSYRLINTTLLRVKRKFFDDLFLLPFPQYESLSTGDLKMRLEDDSAQIPLFAGAQTVDVLNAALTMLISIIWLFRIDWRLTCFAIAAIPLTFWLDHLISKKESVLNDSNRENDQKMISWLQNSIQSWREVKALTLETQQKIQHVRFLHFFALHFAKWINFWTARVLVIPKIKDEFFMRFGLYFFGGFLIINGHIKISDLLVFAMYYEMLSASIKTLSTADAELQSNMPFTNRLLDALGRKDTITPGGVIPKSSRIELNNVSFAYPGSETEVIRHMNLQIEPGERIAITGKSGCGKTTLLKLMMGMVEPTSGEVSFSGIPLSEIDLSAMHSQIGFVMQENVLFNTTIRENLLYGKWDATESECRQACKKAYILDFIDSLPMAMETIIGEKGIKLSGGQRQRLVLARLFLRDVNVFLFDGATSALDQYSENIVQDAITSISKDKIILVVAHRESSIRLCDKKIVLEALAP
jgi:ABC-type bacteriocin/lantibiotic exporter with double-glycine peptidase domain